MEESITENYMTKKWLLFIIITTVLCLAQNSRVTSLKATDFIDGSIPVTITTNANCTIGTNSSGCPYNQSWNTGYSFNQSATAGQAVTYTLPPLPVTTHGGKLYCIKNSNNGSAADTGILKFLVSNTGTQSLIYNGVVSSSGFILSGGSAGDGACALGISSTQWEIYVQVNTWILH